jgi:hypothetical protein
MDYRRITEDTVEIMQDELRLEKVLEEMARLSYETASSPFPGYIQPVEIPASLVDFRSLVTNEGLHMDYLNGKRNRSRVQRFTGSRLQFCPRI